MNYQTPAQRAAADPQVEAMMAAEATHPAPSSFDVAYAAMAGGQDAVLATLIEARERYLVGATSYNYVVGTSVCAVGALMAVDEGLNTRADEGLGMGVDTLLLNCDVGNTWERWAAATSKEALALLNTVAEEHFKVELDDARYRASTRLWSFGPIELLNQGLSWEDREEYAGVEMHYAKAVVLKVYDKAIKLRQEMQPA